MKLRCLLSLIALLATTTVAAEYVANINQQKDFQLRREADQAFLAESYAQAFKAYAQLIDLTPDPDSLYQLGLMHLRGLGTDADAATATAYFQRAAEAGNAAAMRQLAQEDSTRSRRWIEMAANTGDIQAIALDLQARLANRLTASPPPQRITSKPLGLLLTGLLESRSDPTLAARRWHQVMQHAETHQALAQRAAWLLANFYAEQRELAYFWLQLAPPADAINTLPTAQERQIDIDRDTLRSLLESLKRERIEMAAQAWQGRYPQEPAVDIALREFLTYRELPCDAIERAIKTAVAAARVGRRADEIQTDIQNYLPLRDASLSGHSARLELARAVVADFALLGEIKLGDLRTMMLGKCRVGGYMAFSGDTLP